MSNDEVEVIFGRLGKDPEIKYTPKQKAVCKFSVAINKGKSQAPDWRNIVVWGELAESCHVLLKKGMRVFVRGQNVEKEYETTNGQRRKIEELKAWDIGFSR